MKIRPFDLQKKLHFMVFADDAIHHQGLENLIGVLYIVRTDLVLSSQTSLDPIIYPKSLERKNGLLE